MGGGGGLNRWVRVGERFSPFNDHKWVLKVGLKILEKIMYCARNERLQKTKREEGEHCAQVVKFRNHAKFRKPQNFNSAAKALPSTIPAKQRTKFLRICK